MATQCGRRRGEASAQQERTATFCVCQLGKWMKLIRVGHSCGTAFTTQRSSTTGQRVSSQAAIGRTHKWPHTQRHAHLVWCVSKQRRSIRLPSAIPVKSPSLGRENQIRKRNSCLSIESVWSKVEMDSRRRKRRCSSVSILERRREHSMLINNLQRSPSTRKMNAETFFNCPSRDGIHVDPTRFE